MVDGEEVLKEMEKVATDKKDRPVQPIKILSTEILVDPSKEAEEKEYARIRGLAEARTNAEHQKKARSLGKTATPIERRSSGTASSDCTPTIGKYLPKTMIQSVEVSLDNDQIPSIPAAKVKVKKAKPRNGFGNFGSW